MISTEVRIRGAIQTIRTFNSELARTSGAEVCSGIVITFLYQRAAVLRFERSPCLVRRQWWTAW
jgi:hypothetical protein